MQELEVILNQFVMERDLIEKKQQEIVALNEELNKAKKEFDEKVFNFFSINKEKNGGIFELAFKIIEKIKSSKPAEVPGEHLDGA